ncbi:putative DNA polymerase zeta catalytic subunit [Hortaea werneckii]|nr:putative DNA polymerase zeta catalytic subunit [Hortaea werneckii]
MSLSGSTQRSQSRAPGPPATTIIRLVAIRAPGGAKVLNAYAALHDLCALLLEVLFHLTQVAAAEQEFECLLFNLLFCWGPHARVIDLLELELDGTRSGRYCPQSLNMASARRKTPKYNHSCCNVLSSLSTFIPLLTMTLVSKISPSIFASKDFRMLGLTYIIPFGAMLTWSLTSSIDYAAKTSRVAVIVRNHDTWIKTLEVQYQKRRVVEGTLGLHDQWQTFESILCTDLLSRWRDKDETLRLSDSEHQALDFELAASAEYGEEVNAKQAGLLRCSRDQLIGVHNFARSLGLPLVYHLFNSLRMARQTLIVCLPVIRTVDVCVKPQRSASLPKRPCDCAFMRESSSGRLNSYTSRARSMRYPQLLL